jgi:RNA polymerase sigma-70 factor (ECF subfamily)
MQAQLAEPPMIEAHADAPADALARAQAGDEAGFGVLVRQHQARIFSVALRFTGRRAEAEELAQDVFVQLHGALGQIKTPSHLKHWLLRAIAHRCIDQQRREQRRRRLVPIDSMPDVAAAATAPPEDDPLAGARLRHLLQELAPDARAVMLLRYQEDLDPADIATALAMPVNTVKSHLRRSLDWLRAQYRGEEHEY